MDVLIVGATARAAAYSALRAGLRASAIDLFADRDLAAVAPCLAIPADAYPEGLAGAALAFPPGPWMFTGAIENYPDLVGRLSRGRPLWGCPPESLRRVRDPFLVADALAVAGFPALDARRGPAGLARDGSWLRKPFASGGGLGVVPWDFQTEPVDEDEASYYQRRVLGEDLSAIFVGGRNGAILAGLTRQFLGKPGMPFAYRGNLAPWPIVAEVRQRIAAIGALLAREFGLVGLFGVDLVLSNGEPWVVEVNPRYTAAVEVIELSLGIPLLGLHQAAREDRLHPDLRLTDSTRPTQFVAKEILLADRPMVLNDALDVPDRVFSPYEVPEAADLPGPGTRFQEGDPVVTVFGEGETIEGCMGVLANRLACWRARLRRAAS